ncbi:MAG: CBS domain-containing protein [Verrucomicrobia bacterium]|nr:CBS domain-containing protein [Verrucomicrobiota bacterium]MBV9674384.1 CBS domain-containing protein [Verrucomicrobiota bacterium]
MEISGTVSAILAQKKTSTVWSIEPDATVFQAIELMSQKNVGALPVLENDRLVGIISERDYTRKVILKGRSSKETAIREIMTDTVETVSPNDSVSKCMHIITQERVRHLPVLENSKLIGMLSIGDLLKWIISVQDMAIDNLERFVTGSEPAI